MRRDSRRPGGIWCATLTALCALPAVAWAGGEAPSTDLLVGVLSRQAVRECHHDKERWVHPHHEVGFVWLRSDKKVDDSRLRDRLVVVEGTPAARPPIKTRSAGSCGLPMQMRSDWVHGVSGMRVLRAGHPALSAFVPRSIRPFSGLTVKPAGDRFFEVQLRNTVGRTLKQVTLRVHYEGCYGKPGTGRQQRVFATVAAGATVKARFALTLVKPGRQRGRRFHRASSLQVISRTPSVHFALDWSLARARPALSLSCPSPCDGKCSTR